jgi:hypothetical protein
LEWKALIGSGTLNPPLSAILLETINL